MHPPVRGRHLVDHGSTGTRRGRRTTGRDVKGPVDQLNRRQQLGTHLAQHCFGAIRVVLQNIQVSHEPT